ncbi:MAG: UDP-3-O-(3-hydroxymyristoyl)glucosamine N-acyltransferase [Acidobacteriota bacterium]
MASRLGELVGALAERLEVALEGDPEMLIEAVAPLDSAGPHHLSFLKSARHRRAAAASAAGALIVPQDADAEALGGKDRPLLRTPEPAVALAFALELLHPAPRYVPGIDARAAVAEGTNIAPSAHVGALAVVGAGSSVGARSAVLPTAVIGAGCILGEGVVVHPHAVLYDGVRLGDGVIVHAGAVVGADGFGYATDRRGQHHKIPQVGSVVVEDGVEIGALSAVDRGAFEATRIGAGTKVDNLVQVGHNVDVGRHCLLCGQAGVAGSSRLGDGVVLAGQAGVVDHVEIGDRTLVGAASAVLGSHPQGGQRLSGYPARNHAEWRREVVSVSQLTALKRRLKAAERALEALSPHQDSSSSASLSDTEDGSK